MSNTDRLTERGRELARLRQGKKDPGSPCERCKNPACPPHCCPKHDFERGRKRRGDYR